MFQKQIGITTECPCPLPNTDFAEAGPDGNRLFRIRLVAGPAPPPIPAGGNASSSASSSVGGGGFGKAYTLAATSLDDAHDWASAIRYQHSDTHA